MLLHLRHPDALDDSGKEAPYDQAPCLVLGNAARLRHHLKGFLRVRGESGQKMMFRYYDPRVLRVYLPTCNPIDTQLVCSDSPSAARAAFG